MVRELSARKLIKPWPDPCIPPDFRRWAPQRQPFALFLDGRRFNLREPRRSLLCQGFRGHSPHTYTQRGNPWEVNRRVVLAEWYQEPLGRV